MSHVIEFDPSKCKDPDKRLKLDSALVLGMAVDCIPGLEFKLPFGHFICDGKIVDENGKVVTEGTLKARDWADDHKGNYVGDWPSVPKYGAALIRVNDAEGQQMAKTNKVQPYEVAVIPKTDENGEVYYVLAHDFFSGGYGIEEKVGKTELDPSHREVVSGHGELLKYYQAMGIKLAAIEAGHSFEVQELEDGSLTICTDKENVGLVRR